MLLRTARLSKVARDTLWSRPGAGARNRIGTLRQQLERAWRAARQRGKGDPA
jgi:hypothetical protein